MFGQEIVLDFVKQVGGVGGDLAEKIVLDNQNNIYSTGLFSGTTDFDTSENSFEVTSQGLNDIFISKKDENGNLIWVKTIGGTGNDESKSIALDAQGNIYITGFFNANVDFNPNTDVFILNASGSLPDIFILKLDMNGEFVWAKKFGGFSIDYSYGIDVDQNGNVYTTGTFSGTVDFDPNGGVYNLVASGTDIFVSKLDTNGHFVWAKQFTGIASNNLPSDLVVDIEGNVYTTGSFFQTVNFNPNGGGTSLNSNGMGDIYISKMDANGNFIWVNQIGGSGSDRGNSLHIDQNGDLFVSGRFTQSISFDSGNIALDADGGTDGFLAKYDATGGFFWTRHIGGLGTEIINSQTTDNNGNIFITGYFDQNLNLTNLNGTISFSSQGSYDIFYAKLDENGSVIWANALGSTGNDEGRSIAIDTNKSLYIAGYFNNTVDFGLPNCSVELTSQGGNDIFVIKISEVDLDLEEDNFYPATCDNIIAISTEMIVESFGQNTTLFDLVLDYEGEIYNLNEPIVIDFSVNYSLDIEVIFTNPTYPTCEFKGKITVEKPVVFDSDLTNLQNYLNLNRVQICNDSDENQNNVQYILDYIVSQIPGVTFDKTVLQIISEINQNSGEVVITLSQEGQCGNKMLNIFYDKCMVLNIHNYHIEDCLWMTTTDLNNHIDVMRFNVPYATLEYFFDGVQITGMNQSHLILNVLTKMRNEKTGVIQVIASQSGYPSQTIDLTFNLSYFQPEFHSEVTPFYTECTYFDEFADVSLQQVKDHLNQFLINPQNLPIEINQMGGWSVLGSNSIMFTFRLEGEVCWSDTYFFQIIKTNKPNVDIADNNIYSSNCQNTFVVTSQVLEESFGIAALFVGKEIIYDGITYELDDVIDLDFSSSNQIEIQVEFFNDITPDCLSVGVIRVNKADFFEDDISSAQNYLDENSVDYCDGENPTNQVLVLIDYLNNQYFGITISKSVDTIVSEFTQNSGQVAIMISKPDFCDEQILYISYQKFQVPVLSPIIINSEIKVCGSDTGFFENFNVIDAGLEALGNLNSQDYDISYYSSQNAAFLGDELSSYFITNPNSFSNTIPFQQDVWVRITHKMAGCFALSSFKIKVNISERPIITTRNGNVLCVDFTTNHALNQIELSVDADENQSLIQWFLNGTAISGSNQNTHLVLEEGSYTVSVILQNANCPSLISESFEVVKSGPANIINEGYFLHNLEDNRSFSIQVQGFGEYLFGLTPNGPWQESNEFYLGAGVYTVFVKDKNSDCGMLQIKNIFVIDYPRFFTPNGDGFNDIWRIKGIQSFHKAEIYIFDRYGKLIKQLDPLFGWDGTLNGTSLPATDYWFTVVYFQDGVKKEFKSHFSLLR